MLILTIIGGIFALYQYLESVKGQRVAESQRLYQDYIGIGKEAGQQSFKDLLNESVTWNEELTDLLDRVGCAYLSELTGKRRSLRDLETECRTNGYGAVVARLDLQEGERNELRRRLETEQSSTTAPKELWVKLQGLLNYYVAVISCVDNSKCDDVVVIDLLASDMVGFVSAHCVHFSNLAKSWRTDPADDVVVRFLIRKGVRQQFLSTGDPGRTHLFRCEGHRRIEDEM